VSRGHWRCAVCLHRFEGFDSKKRLLALGDEKAYSYFYMGSTDGPVENKIRFLQMCSLLRELGGKAVTNEHLVAAIVSIGDRTTRKLSKFKECRWFTAKDPSEFNVSIFCPDGRLYLSGPGQKFQALDLCEQADQIEELEVHEQHFVLDYVIGMMNWEEKWPHEKSLRKVYWDVQSSPAAKQGRATLHDIVTRM
jgi:hypothetical protein